jgi:hypothetical protein
MAGLDPSVIGNLKTPEPISLSDMLGMASNLQTYQKQKELIPSQISAGKAAARTAEAQAGGAEMELAQKKQNAIAGRYVSMINNPLIVAAEQNPNAVNKIKLADSLKEWGMKQGEEAGVDKATADKLTQPYVELAMTNPAALRTYLKERHITGLDAGARTATVGMAPQITINAAGQLVRTNPITNEVEVVGEAGANQMPGGGGQPMGAPGQIQNQFTQRTSANPTQAQAGMTNVAATNLSTDFTATQQAASGAEPRIALFQNIKKLAPEAFTGVGGARKELASGIAQAVGLDVFTTEKMSTDELAKTSAMLSLAGGNTDMARLMAEAANPNKKMTKEAINQISDQMIGMEKMNQAKYRFLAPVANNPQAYQEKLAQFNRVNDFHIFQETTPEEVAKLKRSMSPDQQRAMGEKIKLARQLGLI